MTLPATQTLTLLQRWHDGDRAALEALITRDFEWVRSYVQRRLGPLLASRGDADDYLQDAMLEALRYTPRFLVSDKGKFRALLGRITENVLRDHAERLRAQKRDPGRERSYVGDTMLSLDPPRESVARPSQIASRGEEQVWLELGLEMLGADERRIVRGREFEDRSFVELAAELGMKEDAVRKRFHRALPKLAKIVRELQAGQLDTVLEPRADERGAVE